MSWLVLSIRFIIIGVSSYFIYSNSEAMTEWGKPGKYNMDMIGWKIFYTTGLILSVGGLINNSIKIIWSIINVKV